MAKEPEEHRVYWIADDPPSLQQWLDRNILAAIDDVFGEISLWFRIDDDGRLVVTVAGPEDPRNGDIFKIKGLLSDMINEEIRLQEDRVDGDEARQWRARMAQALRQAAKDVEP